MIYSLSTRKGRTQTSPVNDLSTLEFKKKKHMWVQPVILFYVELKEEQGYQNAVRNAAALLDCKLFMSYSCVSEASCFDGGWRGVFSGSIKWACYLLLQQASQHEYETEGLICIFKTICKQKKTWFIVYHVTSDFLFHSFWIYNFALCTACCISTDNFNSLSSIKQEVGCTVFSQPVVTCTVCPLISVP